MKNDLIKVLKAVSDENRLKILYMLQDKELCVCEIEEFLGLSQSNTSRHLNKLKEANLIDSVKKGLYVYHNINQDLLSEYTFIRPMLNDVQSAFPGIKSKKESCGCGKKC